MATNFSVIKAFVNNEPASTTNLHTTGDKLVSYFTTIAQRDKEGNVFVNVTKYSPTTSKMQNNLKHELEKRGIPFQTVNNIHMGCRDII